VASAGATQAGVGEALLDEPRRLSVSGKLACASCHAQRRRPCPNPAGTTLPVGGAALDRQGMRSSPTLLYLQAGTACAVSTGRGQPVGGFTWDGRANTRQLQAQGRCWMPWRWPTRASPPRWRPRSRASASYNDLRALNSLPSGASDQQVFDTLTLGADGNLPAARSRSTASSTANTIRLLDGTATLTAQEQRRLHVSSDPPEGQLRQAVVPAASAVPTGVGRCSPTSDAALGLPRNPAIQANADPAVVFDMGLCGPKRTDLVTRTDLCGQFEPPRLRNIGVV
jgi:cytochrome c peroxidase